MKPKPNLKTLASFFLFIMAAPVLATAPSSGSGPYQGHGASSVDAKTLQKYAPPALPSEVSSKVQNMLDIRSPGLGMLHPSGKQLYFGWGVTGVPQVWRLEGPKSFPVQMTAGEDPTSVQDITPDGQWLILSRDRKGEENPGIYLQSTQGGPLKVVQHKTGVQTSFAFVSDDSKWIYYRSNDIKPDSYAIYRYNLDTGERELLFSGEGVWFISDYQPDGRLLLGKATGSLSREYSEWNPKDKKLTPILGQGEKEEYHLQYAAQPGEYLVVTPKFGDFRRLYRLKDGKFTPVSPDLKMDVSEANIDLPRKHIVYQVNDRGYTRLKALDARTYKEIPLPEMKQADQVHPGSMGRTGKTMIIGVETANSPRTSYVYDWASKKLTQWVMPSTPEADPSKFARAKLESYPARDGTPIPMFVTRPTKCEDPKLEKPCPVIVHFHGGPEAQSTPGFSVFTQMLVNEGFIFVEPNVRGSDGYGRKWLDSDNGPKRLDVITDIEDASSHIRKAWARGGVSPKVGVMGWSYGGYSTLAAMTMFAGAYNAGVAMVGMSNLVTFLQNTAPYRRALRISEYGDPEKDREALIKLSPITYLDRLKAPLMIIQGASDPRVPVGEAIQIHEALEAKKIPSQLIVFADEGHGAQKRQNRVLEFGHLMQFFKQHLR